MINNENKPFIVFSFCGQALQSKTLALELYNGNKVFKESMDKLDSYIKNKYFNGESMLNKLRTQPDDAIPNSDQFVVHSFLFMFQVSIFELLKSEGITPSVIYGASCGEISASYCSGILDLETACNISFFRATIISKVSSLNPPAKLIGINVSNEEFIERFQRKYPKVEVIAKLKPDLVYVGCSDIEQVDSLFEDASNQGLELKSYPAKVAFHSSAMDCIKEDVLKQTIIPRPSIIPIFSCVNGIQFNEKTFKFDQNYLFRNLRDTVENVITYHNIFKYIEENGGKKAIVVEISPNPTMLANIFDSLKTLNSKLFNPINENYKNNITFLPTLDKTKNDVLSMNETIEEIKKQLI
ncbi:hypothetical protein RB653_001134 [Dictyostelium firmibasis]|uniref:Malonyl-CoA:ACP transacylase (MAT) domain-containing protein n=1 Tax=Dictyostelium firmibasis TaxID=79012 RepID=A0AAN7YWF0_9MYCE